MNSRWTMRAVSAAIALTLLGATSACSTPGTAAPESAPAATRPAVPGAAAITLPSFWDGRSGGVFEFSSSKTVYTPEAVLTIGSAKTPVLWSWDGQSTALAPASSGESAIEDCFIFDRDGQWLLATLWRGTVPAVGDTPAGSKVTLNISTWNSKGEILFQGPVDKIGVSLDQSSPWAAAGGMLVRGAGLAEKSFGDSRDVQISPLTGQVSRTPERVHGDSDAPFSADNGRSGTNPNLVIEHSGAAAPWRITNTTTGAVTDLPPVDPCEPTSTPTTLVSSFDGRYLAFGRNVIDSKDGTAACLDGGGSAHLTAITSGGVGYGTDTRNGQNTTVSYDFARAETTQLDGQAIAPVFVGPDDVAVVAGSANSAFSVYRTAK